MVERMKNQIKNPYSINWKLYFLIAIPSVLLMVFAVVWNNATNSIISDVIKNLSFGCVASILVALLIEIGNIREKNLNANNVYDSIYFDLKFQIMCYLNVWAQLCVSSFIETGEEKHTWNEWYEILKEQFNKSSIDKQKRLIRIFEKRILYCINNIENSLDFIKSQQNILIIHNLFDDELDSILKDFKFEFFEAKNSIHDRKTIEEFWIEFDAINSDLKNYIERWIDISYFNNIRFSVNRFYDDKEKVENAIKICESKNKRKS